MWSTEPNIGAAVHQGDRTGPGVGRFGRPTGPTQHVRAVVEREVPGGDRVREHVRVTGTTLQRDVDDGRDAAAGVPFLGPFLRGGDQGPQRATGARGRVRGPHPRGKSRSSQMCGPTHDRAGICVTMTG
ncbi:hypothetical protein GCM10022384_65550 [Streptomyces marokkonensis]|uniref:Uncharacterized protein n=1 Tax=Streptomyces marokkonensis TaxID=324855 RepID=A0ABP7SGG9_9ACTN